MTNFSANASGATWWPNFPTNARIVKEVIIVTDVKICGDVFHSLARYKWNGMEGRQKKR